MFSRSLLDHLFPNVTTEEVFDAADWFTFCEKTIFYQNREKVSYSKEKISKNQSDFAVEDRTDDSLTFLSLFRQNLSRLVFLLLWDLCLVSRLLWTGLHNFFVFKFLSKTIALIRLSLLTSGYRFQWLVLIAFFETENSDTNRSELLERDSKNSANKIISRNFCV